MLFKETTNTTGGIGSGNSKHEIRNPKQIRMLEIQMFKAGLVQASKIGTRISPRRFDHSLFDIRVCFEFRASDFGF